MPDFGLAEALQAALKSAGKGPIMRPAEVALADAAARKSGAGAAAPTVPGAGPAPSLNPPPEAVQAPQVNPSQPPQDMPPPQPQDALSSPNAQSVTPDAAASTATATPGSQPVVAASEPIPQAVTPVTNPAVIAPGNELPPQPPPGLIPPSLQGVQEQADRFVRANMGQYADKLDMTHMPNVDRMTSPDQVKAAILQVADDNRGTIEASRGTAATHEQLVGLAQDMAVDTDTLQQTFAREFGTTNDVAGGDHARAVFTAARMVEQNEAGQVLALSARIADGTASSRDIVQFTQHSEAMLNWRTMIAGENAEVGRNLAARGIKVGADLPPEVLDHIAGLLSQGNPQMPATAEAIRLAGTPAGINNILMGMNGLGTAQKLMAYTAGLIRRVYINGILSGPPTWARIFYGNTFNLALNAGDLFVAGIGRGIYGAASRALGFPTADEGVQLSDAVANVHGILSAGMDGFRVAGRVLATGKTAEGNLRALESTPKNSPQAVTDAFPSLSGTTLGAITTVLDRTIDMPGAIVGAIDQFGQTLGYRGYLTMMQMKELRARAAAGTLKPGDAESVMQDLMKNPDPSVQQAADAWAVRMTFQSPFPEGGPGEKFQQFLNAAPMLRLIFPFMRTAINIFKQSAVERTPLAAFSARVRAQIAAGGFEGDLAKSKLLSGVAFMSGLAWMAIHDRYTGAAPKDPKEAAAWALDGRKPYSFRITDPITGKDEWLSFLDFEPIASVAGTVADIVKLQSYMHRDPDSMLDKDHRLWDAISHVAASVITNLGDKTYMQGAAAFSEAYNDPKRALKQWAEGMAANMVPFSAATRFVRNLQDPYLRQAQTIVQHVENNLPSTPLTDGSKSLAVIRDVFGNARQHNSANTILGPMSPFPGNTVKPDPVLDEVQRVMEQSRTAPIHMPAQQMSMGANGRGLEGGSGMHLTPEEYSDYVRLARGTPNAQGLTFHDQLERAINTSVYQAATPAVRSGLLSNVQNNADAAGRAMLWSQNEAFRQRMQAWQSQANRLKYNTP